MRSQVRYDPSDWYWVVGGDQTKLWSSAAAAFVAPDAAAYLAWQAAGNAATAIDTLSNLQGVLAVQYPPGWPGGDLAAQIALGVPISCAGTPAVNGTYAMSDVARMNIIAIETSLNAGKGFPGPNAGPTFDYLDMSGAPHTFTEALFTAFAAAVRDRYYRVALAAGTAARSLQAPVYPSGPMAI